MHASRKDGSKQWGASRDSPAVPRAGSKSARVGRRIEVAGNPGGTD